MIHCANNEKSMYEEVGYWRSLPELVPSVVFQTRIKNFDGSFSWKAVNTFDLFSNQRVLVFSLPGAFTPTCSTYQLPSFEQMAEEFYAEDIQEIICMTVNDAFVCNAWATANNIQEITVIPDGSCKFTEGMSMVVDKDNLGFGRRSWRYACIVDNGTITDWFIEEGKEDNCKEDPYMYTKPSFILEQLRGGN